MVRTVLAVLLALTVSAGGAQRPGTTIVLQLAEEFSARSGPGFWGDTSGTLVRERLPVLLESQSNDDARWFGDLLKRLDAIPQEELSSDDWITWAVLRWEADLGARRHAFFWLDVPIAPYSSPLRTITNGFTAARLTTADERQRYLDGLHRMPVLAAQLEAKLRGQAARGIVRCRVPPRRHYRGWGQMRNRRNGPRCTRVGGASGPIPTAKRKTDI